MAEKTYRISKVATELNVSWKSLIEHLNDSGFQVDVKPTVKIGQDMYDVLEQKFRSDKQAKEESQALEIHIRRQDETLVADRKTPKKKKKDSMSDVVLIKDTGLTMKSQETTPAEPPKQETPPPPPPKVEEKKVVEVVEEKPAEPVKEEKKQDLPGLKVLGKIELDKPKPEPKPKVEEKAPEKPAETKAPEPEKKVETPAAEKTEKPVAKEKPADQPPVEEVKVIRPQYEKLDGLTIKGKIQLPDPPKKKKPVASSEGKPEDNLRKKRKRTTKGDAPVRGGRRGGREEVKEEITEKEIQDKIKATLAKLGGQKGGGKSGNQRQKLRRQRREDHKTIREEEQLQKEKESMVLKVTEFVTANELSVLMDVSVNEIITACFSLGMMVSINQRLDAETIQIVAEEFGYTVQFVDAEEQVEFEEEPDDPADLEERWPIVTVMGHVDHGKTSLLDYIRNANVIAGEAGGITQHVAAYEVQLKNKKKITFVDTPGHEAFTAMRARGAKVTDVAIIVIAADDNVMPQTKEAISHAQAAGVPIVFAINKIDRENANPDKIREELSAMNILVEEWGGSFQAQEISAKKGSNIDELLDKVLLEAEMLELKANPDKRAKGTVMEAQLDKGRGVLASILVQEGTLSVGDALVAGHHFCRVRAMFNERMQPVKTAGPSTPVNILGFTSAPTAGDVFQVFESEQDAKDIANRRAQLQREQGIRATKHLTLDDIGRRLAIGNFKELKVIVKADVDGSSEALSDSLIKLSTEEIQVNVIHKSVGAITESDVLLASASDAIIIGFQVRPVTSAKKLAEQEEIDIRLYSVIYQAIDEIKAAMEGMLAPEFEEKITGNAEIREVFKISKVGAVAGCMITDGKIARDNKVRLIRDGVVVYSGEMASLKRFKDDVKEVNRGFECGIQIKNYNDIREGDIIECYEEIEVKRKLK
ncbi:MAG: translation initiation factor IF-2 [Flavobacteriales bacterium]|nr:translation initiation factor IF-2 [Bacteroidota bacterium]MCB9240874.1 translation initiation factor IF-2 [Flavobacteriales bacterium]